MNNGVDAGFCDGSKPAEPDDVGGSNGFKKSPRPTNVSVHAAGALDVASGPASSPARVQRPGSPLYQLSSPKISATIAYEPRLLSRDMRLILFASSPTLAPVRRFEPPWFARFVQLKAVSHAFFIVVLGGESEGLLLSRDGRRKIALFGVGGSE